MEKGTYSDARCYCCKPEENTMGRIKDNIAAFHAAMDYIANPPKETKAEKVARKQRESIPLEREESRKLGLRHLNKSADRMGYDRPVNRQAAKDKS